MGLSWSFVITVLPPLTWVRPAYAGWAVTHYYGREEALAAALPRATSFLPEVRVLTPDEKRRIEAKLKAPLKETYFEFWVGRGAGGETEGYALVLDEIGKHLPITFMVALKPSGEVEDCVVMAFREPRGGEVSQRRFLRQFRGKTSGDAIRLQDDITHVTGSTLSCRAACFVVRKAVAAYEVLMADQAI